MTTKTKNLFKYVGCIGMGTMLGIILTLELMPVVGFIGGFFGGFEIQSMASFPYYHTAKIRTRPGLGDQTLFFEVDGKDVWVSGDAAPGDLNEKIYWDSTGTIVSFELAGKKTFVFNAESKTEVKEKTDE